MLSRVLLSAHHAEARQATDACAARRGTTGSGAPALLITQRQTRLPSCRSPFRVQSPIPDFRNSEHTHDH